MSENKDLIESYKLTTVRDRIGIYGQRLILRLVELATAEGATQGLDFKSGKDIRQVEVGLWGENTVTMPLADIIGDSDNRSKPRKAIIALMQEIIEAEDEDGDWFAFPFLTFAQVKNGMLTVKVRQELWQVFMDFRKGFRRFELEAALQLKSTYSLRLYKLMSEQHETEYLDFQLDELKKMLGVGGKYRLAKDFGKWVLDPAKAELDRVAPWTFTYSWLTSRKVASGRAAIVGVRFFPRYQPQHRDPDLLAQQVGRKHAGNNPLAGITLQQQQLLIKHYGFTYKGLNTAKNAALFNAAAKYLDFTSWLLEIMPRVEEEAPDNIPGFIIGCLRRDLAAQGIEV